MSLNLFTDEEIAALIFKANAEHWHPNSIEDLRNALNAAVEMKIGEPVAWRVTSNEKSHREFRELAFHEPHKRSDWDVTGLYTIQSTKE